MRAETWVSVMAGLTGPLNENVSLPDIRHVPGFLPSDRTVSCS